MILVVVDYSEAYHAERGEPLPARRSGKFVQIRHEDRELLILSPKELTPYHTDIVERLCAEEGLPCSQGGQGKTIVINDPSWVIVGGGRFDRDGDQRYLRLYDTSTAYGPFDAKGLAEKMGSAGELEGYRLIIG